MTKDRKEVAGCEYDDGGGGDEEETRPRRVRHDPASMTRLEDEAENEAEAGPRIRFSPSPRARDAADTGPEVASFGTPQADGQLPRRHPESSHVCIAPCSLSE